MAYRVAMYGALDRVPYVGTVLTGPSIWNRAPGSYQIRCGVLMYCPRTMRGRWEVALLLAEGRPYTVACSSIGMEPNGAQHINSYLRTNCMALRLYHRTIYGSSALRTRTLKSIHLLLHITGTALYGIRGTSSV